MPAFSETISIVPPCSAETFWASPPSTPPGNMFTLILPPLLAATSSANFSMPITMGWPLGFCVANLTARSLMSCAAARPQAASARAATAVLSTNRFIVCLQSLGV